MLKTGDGLEIPCICVTNRKLCRGDFLERLRRIVGGEITAGTGMVPETDNMAEIRMKADAVLLREKDMQEEEYFFLAEKVMKICEDFSVPCILHSFYRAAGELGCSRIHLPLGALEEAASDLSKGRAVGRVSEPENKPAGETVNELGFCFQTIGTSVHSVEQVKQAAAFGADYVIAGHVFATDCKKGMPGRGLGFVQDIVKASRVPVYGIGGVDAGNAPEVMKAGASGVCIMSGFMLDNEV